MDSQASSNITTVMSIKVTSAVFLKWEEVAEEK